MFRFSRDKRFHLNGVSFKEFAEASAILADMIKNARPNASVEILTTEDANTHNYAQVTFVTDEVTEALEGRKSYSLQEFTEMVWERSMSAQLTLRDETDTNSFMVCLSWDQEEPHRMMFYGQAVEPQVVDEIYTTFSRPSLLSKIGDGFPKSSSFNQNFAQINFGPWR